MFDETTKEYVSDIEAKILAHTSLSEKTVGLVFWILFHIEDLHGLTDFSKSVKSVWIRAWSQSTFLLIVAKSTSKTFSRKASIPDDTHILF